MRNLLIAAALACACAAAPPPNIATTTFDPSVGVNLAQSTPLSNGEYIRDLSVGLGAPIATGQQLSVYFTMHLPDGTALGTNIGGTPYTFVLGAGTVVAGLDQGFGEMKLGGTRQFIVPPALAYGDQDQANTGVPPNSIVVYELQAIDPAATQPNIAATAFNPSLEINLPQWTVLPNGEYTLDTVTGTGAPIASGQHLSAFYSLHLPDGTLLQTNVGGTPLVFQLGAGQVIQGWEQGLGGMNVGGTRQLIVPPSLGYGDTAFVDSAYNISIPGTSILVFNLQIVAAQ
jgi:peptidylprolyl isomerase